MPGDQGESGGKPANHRVRNDTPHAPDGFEPENRAYHVTSHGLRQASQERQCGPTQQDQRRGNAQEQYMLRHVNRERHIIKRCEG